MGSVVHAEHDIKIWESLDHRLVKWNSVALVVVVVGSMESQDGAA